MQAAWMNIRPLEVLQTVERDNAWVKLLPEGSRITSTKGHGASYWSRTARIDTLLPDGQEKSYFLKLATPNGGLLMCRGEYESMTALHTVAPNFVPRPVDFGTYESDPTQHFFLCDFIDLDDELPHIVDFCEKLAGLHERSQDMAPQLHNPNKMFGFHVVTCNGTVPTNQIWCESWEHFYTENMKHLFAWEEKMQGPCERFDELLPKLYEKVIPRLLRPLETEGRVLKASLLHGDLWDGNTAVHTRTDAPYIFDASSFWGHNECDLAKWRGARYRMRRMYIKEYFKYLPVSPPEEDWEDRNLLYSLRADLHDSILFPATTRFRDLLIVTLEKLVHKFPAGYEGSAARKGSEMPEQQADAETINHKAELPVFVEHQVEVVGSVTPEPPVPGSAEPVHGIPEPVHGLAEPDQGSTEITQGLAHPDQDLVEPIQGLAELTVTSIPIPHSTESKHTEDASVHHIENVWS